MTAAGRHPLVGVISLGGTIAMAGAASAVVPQITGAQLVEAVPSFDSLADIEVHDFRQLPGASLRLDDLYALASKVDEVLDAGADGIVITQGTDTIEEMAYVLDLLLDRVEPVVVTGAMRNPTLPGADGPANLHAAAVVASSGRDLKGVVVAFADEVHAARTVIKTNTMSVDAFESPQSGPMGLVVEGHFRVRTLASERTLTVPRVTQHTSVSVPVMTVGLDTDAQVLNAGEGADAVVLAALGAGHVPEWLADPIGEIASRVPVVLASRTRSGPILRSTYGFVGSEQDLRSRGVLAAGSLDMFKLRMLLLLLLRSGADKQEIETHLRWFDES